VGPDAEAFRAEITVPHWPAAVTAATEATAMPILLIRQAASSIRFGSLLNRTTGNGLQRNMPGHVLTAAVGVILLTIFKDHGRLAYQLRQGWCASTNRRWPNDVPSRLGNVAHLQRFASESGLHISGYFSRQHCSNHKQWEIPIGALLMLPPTYNTSQIASPALRKIAETLKLYGAYVVDRNQGTPYVIYVENGASFHLNKGRLEQCCGQRVGSHQIQPASSLVCKSWVDGNDKPFTPKQSPNILSLRGPWKGSTGQLLAFSIHGNNPLSFPLLQTVSSSSMTPCVG